MAVSAASALNVTGTDTDARDYTTASWTPTAGNVYVVGLGYYDAGGNGTTPTLSGNGITWTYVNGASGTFVRIDVWVGVADGSSTAGALTFSGVVSAAQTADGATWGIASLSGARNTTPIVQSGYSNTTSDSVTVNLSAFASSANATGAWVLSYDNASTTGPAITAGSGFAITSGLNAEQAAGGDGLRLAFEFRNDNDTTVDATADTANDRLQMVAFEIAAAVLGTAAGASTASGAAVGTPTVLGVAAGAATASGSAVGTPTVLGVASGTATASGSVTVGAAAATGRDLWGTGYTLFVEAAFSATYEGSGVWDAGVWDTATWGPDVIWSDVTTDLFAFSSRLGRNREDGHFTAAGGQVILDNVSGDYTPENLSGPYVAAGVTGIRPGRPIRAYVTSPGGTVYPVFFGRIEDFDELLNKAPQTTFVWVDGIAQLAGVDGYEQTAQGSGELAGVRLHRVLDNAGWAGDRAIDEGAATMQPTTLAQDAWTEILLTADSEGGEVWIDPDGTFVFEDREARLRNTRSNTVQYVFTDDQTDTTGYPFESVTLLNGMDILANEVALARSGGTVTVEADEDSKALYELARWGRNDLIVDNDTYVSLLAQFILERRKDPTRKPRAIVLNPRVYDSLWPVVLGLRIGDRVTVTRHHEPTMTAITHSCFVDGIEHAVSGGEWLTTVRLAATSAYPSSAEFGVWDTSLWDATYWGVSA